MRLAEKLDWKGLKYCQSLVLNFNVHEYNTRRKMDIQVQSHKTDLYNKSVINMGTKLYSKMSGYIKEMDIIRSFRKH
jgi:hypothetical protein